MSGNRPNWKLSRQLISGKKVKTKYKEKEKEKNKEKNTTQQGHGPLLQSYFEKFYLFLNDEEDEV